MYCGQSIWMKQSKQTSTIWTYTFGAHKRTVLSFDPEAMIPPALETATENTGPCFGEKFEDAKSFYQALSIWDLVITIPISTKMWFEIPYHDRSIKRTRNKLFHIWVEYDRCDCIFMPSKGPLKDWILRHKTKISHWTKVRNRYIDIGLIVSRKVVTVS